ncbi:hypothetical protein Pcinc_040768 [Petrolisthes cinctipes]|uniref:Uncharacterized protein n=1 Tax=Petrolisthes cinctipes TaxID=88211 RepID=A0AAE1BNJ4_PETCI|nr:hypothetical protein Pcinc_040768 [Petrolisthes cinctipes]
MGDNEGETGRVMEGRWEERALIEGRNAGEGRSEGEDEEKSDKEEDRQWEENKESGGEKEGCVEAVMLPSSWDVESDSAVLA